MREHPDRTTLAKYMEGDPVTDRPGIATHVTGCAACQSELEELQATFFLHDNVLDFIEARKSDRKRPPEQFDILATRQRMGADAARAESFFGELMRLPIEEWPSAFEANPQHCTEGMVLRLLTEVEIEVKRRPQHAMQLINVAEIVTRSLGIPAIHACAGDCWKQRANALRHLGRYAESLEAADLAAAFYRLIPLGDFEIGQALYTRAVTLFKMTQYDEALAVLDSAKELLREFGDTMPLAKTLILEACIRFEQGEVEWAERTWIEVVPMLKRFDDRIELARVRANLAECSLKRGRPASALAQAQAAATGFAELQMDAERVRSEWMVAAILRALGEHDRALELLYSAAVAFRALGMSSDAGFVSLDITEELLRRNEWTEAANIARELAGLFTSAGVTLASVTALSYLRTAVEGERATPALVRYVRDYVAADDPSRTFSAPS
jgi:tetratricopeptide (TPR) repeat protein